MNKFIFTGNLGKDCEVKSLPSGTSVCEFSVAVKSGYKENEKTNWANCAIFGKKAEGGLPSYLKKGTQVAIVGELELQEWDTSTSKGAKLVVKVEDLDLIGGQPQGQSTAQQPPAQQAPQQTAQQAPPQMAPQSKGYYWQDGAVMSPADAQYYTANNIAPWVKGTPPPQ